MVNGIQHKIPVSTSFNLFNYINVSPSFNYNAVWLFREVTQAYDPDAEITCAGHDLRIPPSE